MVACGDYNLNLAAPEGKALLKNHALRPAWLDLGEDAEGVRTELGIDNRPDPGVHWDDPVMPPNLYGATKCWGEAVGRVYSISKGL